MKHNIFAFHVEPVQGCTRRCDFCGLNRISEQVRMANMMELGLAEMVAEQISEMKSRVRVDFSLHGEPLMHPEINKIIRIFRTALPQAQLAVISNGDLIARGKVDTAELFDSGLNYLMIDLYERSELQTKELNRCLRESGIQIFDYPERSIWRYNSSREQGIVLVEDVSKTHEPTRQVHTAGGNLPDNVWNKYGISKEEFPKQLQCSKPFTELSINYDGNVSICCEDWQRKNAMFNVNETTLKEMWDSEEFEKVRYLLYNKRRDLLDVCYYCNVRSFRTGLYKPTKDFPELL